MIGGVMGETTDKAGAGELRLSSKIGEIPGQGKKRVELFGRLEIYTVGDLIRHLPMRYEFEAAEGPIAELTLETIGSTRGTVVASRVAPGPGGPRKARFEVTLKDFSGTLSLTWFNAGYLREKIKPGMELRVQGKVKAFNGYPQIVNAVWEVIEADDVREKSKDRFKPVYPATEDLPSGKIERVIMDVLPRVLGQVQDPLPETLRAERAMPTLADAFRMAHMPAHEDEAKAARRRFAFNELLVLQLGIAIKRHFNRTQLEASKLGWSAAIDAHIRERFPFALTEDQEAVVKEIIGDLQSEVPMNRLLQGDVGSGKTIVALYAMLMAVANRKQGAIMVPTELLAEQHYASISRILKGSSVRVALLTSGAEATTGAKKAQVLEDVRRGRVDIVIGTQALLTSTVGFKELAVVVIDEQHRFGVLQRAAIRDRSRVETSGEPDLMAGVEGERTEHPHPSPPPEGEGVKRKNQSPLRRGQAMPAKLAHSPHYLVMTATPIPRTLSMTIFGDLDVSTIKHLPPGRQPVATRAVGTEKSEDVYRYVAQRVADGEQAYVVLPAIDENTDEGAKQLKNVTSHIKLLRQKYFADKVVEAVHGQLSQEERERVMSAFRAGTVDVLVATTVIEVGVDVPKATMIVIEHAERFGLAQLHQLRGRVGRGPSKRKSLCVLIGDPVTPESDARLKAMVSTTDGFKIAENDLEIRGMGDFFGTRQHGMPPLKVAKIPEDMDLLLTARRDAETIVKGDPQLRAPELGLLRRVLIQQHGEALGLIDVA
jgi:ATP-dependent DNA helicase RecG